MAWPSKTIGELYSTIYASEHNRAFHVSLARDLLRDPLKAKVYLHRLKNLGWAYSSPIHGRGMYRLQAPLSCVLLAAGKIASVARVRDQTYSGLIAMFASEASGIRGLKSLVLYGSVARGQAKANSDVDIFGVFEDREMRDGFDSLTRFRPASAIADELLYLRASGIDTQISFLPMSTRQFNEHPFILLDIVTDGLPIIDDGTFMKKSSEIKRSLRKLQARKVFRSKDDWYWDLLPHYSLGAKVTI